MISNEHLETILKNISQYMDVRVHPDIIEEIIKELLDRRRTNSMTLENLTCFPLPNEEPYVSP